MIKKQDIFLPIPAYGPPLDNETETAVVQALRNGDLIGNGSICRRVEAEMRQLFAVRHVLLTASCTAALEMALLALDIGPGDEVILPSFTFVSSANCIVLRGGKPVFADICSQTLNLDPEDVARRITRRTRVIIPVHYAGIACDMTALQALADAYGISLVEDAAQAVDARYRGLHLGTLGTAGCFSFHATKNIVCGEGGAFLTNDDDLAHRAEIIREKGTNRAAFLRGDVDKYTWISAGSSYILSDLLAAVLESQLQKRMQIKKQRQAVWDIYMAALKPLADTCQLYLPTVPGDCEPNYHIFYLRAQSPDAQEALIRHLREHGIPAAFHYVPLHTSPFGRSLSGNAVELLQTDHCAATLVRLPIGTHISSNQAEFVADQVLVFYKNS